MTNKNYKGGGIVDGGYDGINPKYIAPATSESMLTKKQYVNMQMCLGMTIKEAESKWDKIRKAD